MRVFITGGTGLIGTKLVAALIARGDIPVALTRNADAARRKFGDNIEFVSGDPMRNGPWQDTLAGCDAVINLVGQGVFDQRWSPEYKKLLADSRILSTRNVVTALARGEQSATGPKILVSTSAIGYYGPHGDEELDEDSPPAHDFLGQLSIDWENEAKSASTAGVRVAIVRVGIVLDQGGGALAKLILPFSLGGGGPVGSGRQYMAWIHIDDLVRLFLWAVDHPNVAGPLNGTAPHPVTNKAFGHALGKAMGRPSFVWTPGFALHLLLGEAAEIVLNGQRVLPRRVLELGFTFNYPTIDVALAQIFAKK